MTILLIYRELTRRPIMGVVAGLNVPPGRIMGHAGAWAAPGEPNADAKAKALERAGVVTVNHPEKLGDGMKKLLNNRTSARGAVSLSFNV